MKREFKPLKRKSQKVLAISKTKEIMKEYENIVEFSFNPKQEKFVVRFLDGKSYVLDITALPKKMQTKKPMWEDAYLSGSHNAIVLVTSNGKEIREIPAFMIHANGKEL